MESTLTPVFAEDALSGRTALVTGGGSGIGFAIALAMLNAGARVVIASRNAERLGKACRQLDPGGQRATWRQVDVCDPDQVRAAVDASVEAFGGLDIMVANAAGNFVVPTAKMSPNAWRTVIDIDLNGTFNCASAAYAPLCASSYGGRLIAISTMRALQGWPGCAHAGAAKAGVMSLMRTLSVEWGPDGILCNTIAPGAIGDTEGVSRIYDDTGRRDLELSTIPLGRFGKARDVAQAAVFLASDAGSYVTGTDLVVDGGRNRANTGMMPPEPKESSR